MTLTEAADELGVKPATLRHQIRNGSLDANKVGRDWTVTDDAVRSYAAISLGRPGRRPRRPAAKPSADQMTLDLIDGFATAELA